MALLKRLLAVGALVVAGCEGATSPGLVVSIASISLSPVRGSIIPGGTLHLTATLRDSAGDTVRNRPIAWASRDTSIATVSSTGLVRGVAVGTTGITATADTVTALATIEVVPPVNAVVVTPAALTIVMAGTFQLTATLLDAARDTLRGRAVLWSSSDTAVASVSATGLVTGRRAGTATITAASEGRRGTARLGVRTVSFTVISAGSLGNACAVTTDSLAFCWGNAAIGNGSAQYYASSPVQVTDTLKFRSISAGEGFTCGVSTTSRAYCWGFAAGGRLGNGSGGGSILSPVAVSGGLIFDSLSSGHSTTCALTADGAAYCWGWNTRGELGNGGGQQSGTTPVPVAGGLTFISISSGNYTVCGLAADSTAYCWGANYFGETGSGDTTTFINIPRAVAGGLKFRSVSAAYNHSCGVATSGAAYCWGRNSQGQLGTGDTLASRVPVPVGGGLTFATVSAGGNHVTADYTCGITAAGATYCWGSNDRGQLGDGSTTNRLGPVPISGGLPFASLSAGGLHACGITADGVTYCWGYDGGLGALGAGGITQSSIPIRVLGQP